MPSAQSIDVPASGTTSNPSLVELIPWDFDSPEHIARLIEQRVSCGWHEDIVESVWTKKQRAGKKCIYWITLSPQHASSEEYLEAHFSAFPSDKVALKDTATFICGSPRKPTHSPIFPIGHISVDLQYPEAEHLDLDLPDEGVFWIKTFYVSTPLRSKGAGRAAMDEIEDMATREPLSAKVLALDTIHQEDARRMAFEETGEVVKTTNHEWYERRGYRLIKTIPNFYQSQTEVVFEHKTVFMRRDVV